MQLLSSLLFLGSFSTEVRLEITTLFLMVSIMFKTVTHFGTFYQPSIRFGISFDFHDGNDCLYRVHVQWFRCLSHFIQVGSHFSEISKKPQNALELYSPSLRRVCFIRRFTETIWPIFTALVGYSSYFIIYVDYPTKFHVRKLGTTYFKPGTCNGVHLYRLDKLRLWLYFIGLGRRYSFSTARKQSMNMLMLWAAVSEKSERSW